MLAPASIRPIDAFAGGDERRPGLPWPPFTSEGGTRVPGESQQALKHRAARIVRRLARAYPDAKIALRHRNAFQLLVATILSAQCTDEKVNEVTPALFRRYPKPGDLADAEPSELEGIIRSTGFYRQKTKSLLGTARNICERFGGRVPKTLEELVSLPGVARKTANIVLGESFGVPGLAVDTHMKRVNQRLGLTRSSDPNAIERDLMALIPQQEWIGYTRRVIHHGRSCCNARRPQCESCPLGADCPWPARTAIGKGAARR